jgi:thioredoxin 1
MASDEDSPIGTAGDGAPWLVACLCAAWCRTCNEYRPTFAAAAHAHPDMRFAWIDIEDHSDALGPLALDIDDFPTLLIARGSALRFLGPVLPHGETLLRTIEAARAATLTPSAADGLSPTSIAHLHGVGERID